MNRKSFQDRFWEKVSKTNGCWLWLGGQSLKGYGQFEVKKPSGRFSPDHAHRVAYQLTYGPLLSGIHVLHRCDNRLCVNPDHLFLGTNGTNMKDRNDKNRQAKGEKQGASKLSERQVKDIRYLCGLGIYSQKDIAHRFGVTPTNINDIVKRKSWAWLEDHKETP